ncbi:hypothetical protein [Streptomyces sp. NPDC050388]|uniref:hypothetical protein n=1 Tax=Streptomyces sp. NPDC050388 TaxID=3155781 RepID=UPI0034369D49
MFVELDAKACTSGSKTAKAPANSCEPANFPWTTSEASADRELAGAGVRARGDVTLTVEGQTIHEVVLAPSPAEKYHSIEAAYRDHLQGCKAQVVDSREGKSDWFRLASTTDQLLVSFKDGVVIALRAERSHWSDEQMGELMHTAEWRSEKFVK